MSEELIYRIRNSSSTLEEKISNIKLVYSITQIKHKKIGNTILYKLTNRKFRK